MIDGKGIDGLTKLSAAWDDLGLNDDVQDYPFKDSFDEVIYDIDDKEAKKIEKKTIKWLKEL